MELRPGVLAIATLYGRNRPVAECVSCERVRPLRGRGLCDSCRDRHSDDGTLGDWGYVKADRMEEFARLRAGGLNITEAGRRVCVSRRTASRYEAALVAAGEACWVQLELTLGPLGIVRDPAPQQRGEADDRAA